MFVILIINILLVSVGKWNIYKTDKNKLYIFFTGITLVRVGIDIVFIKWKEKKRKNFFINRIEIIKIILYFIKTFYLLMPSLHTYIYIQTYMNEHPKKQYIYKFWLLNKIKNIKNITSITAIASKTTFDIYALLTIISKVNFVLYINFLKKSVPIYINIIRIFVLYQLSEKGLYI